jgi:P27 family predicted phage terminase small subunit
MPAGRPPKPVEQKRRLGNPGQRPLPAVADTAALPELPFEPPEDLGPDGVAFIQGVVASTPWLANTDRPTVELAARLVDECAEIQREINEAGRVFVTEKGYPVINPLVGALSTSRKQLHSVLASLGYTPADRTRMGLAEVKAKNAFEDMLAKRATYSRE